MLNKIFSKTHQRTAKAYKNIIGLFAIKGAGMLISLLLVPLTLSYLDSERYGIWITLSTIITWFALFDIGLGNGLRNRLVEAIAKNDIIKAKIYVSTTYAGLLILFSSVYIIFFVINFFLDWSVILNTSSGYKDELNILVSIVFLFFCLQFVGSLIYTIALAKQEPAMSQAFGLLGSALSLLGIYLLTLFTYGKLLYLGLLLSGIPFLVSMIISFILFKGRYKNIRPSIKYIKFSELKSLLNIGIKFFFLQIVAIVLYQTNNFIITQLFGPSEVTPYNISFKFFNIATFAFATILTPYWSAITDAYYKNEIDWIKKVMKNLKYVWLVLVIIVSLMYLFSEFFIHLWVGNSMKISLELNLIMAIYVIITSLLAIYSSFLNGVGKIMIQFYASALLAIFHIPLAIFFGQKFGISGTMFSIIIFGILQIFVFEMQYRKIINKKDKGIWSK